MPSAHTVSAFRLAAFYFFYFASIGVFMPYWGKYLASLGYDAQAIGLLVGAVMATKIIAPYIWGVLSDRTGKRIALIKLACLLTPVLFLGVYVDVGGGQAADQTSVKNTIQNSALIWLVVVMLAYSFFWNAVLPLYEAVTMDFVNSHHALYSKIRLWGSVGFVVLSVGMGWLIQHVTMGLNAVPHIFLLCLIGVGASALSLKQTAPIQNQQASDHISIFSVLSWPLMAFLIACMLMQLSHGAYYTFFSIYLTDSGYNDTQIGLFWGAAVLAEVLAFAFMKPLMQRFGVQTLLVSALLLTAVRWAVLSYLQDSAVWVLLTQIIHAASFGTFHAASIVVVHRLFPETMQARGQALYTSVSFGLGGAVGAYVSGYLWSRIGGDATFLLSGACALIGAVVAWVGLRAVASKLHV